MARYDAFVYDEDGGEDRIDLRDYGNLDDAPGYLLAASGGRAGWRDREHSQNAGVESIARPMANSALRVHGMEFARTAGGELLVGIHRKRSGSADEATALARNLARLRSPDAADRLNPLYLANPEAWLESQVRGQIERESMRNCSQRRCTAKCRPSRPPTGA